MHKFTIGERVRIKAGDEYGYEIGTVVDLDSAAQAILLRLDDRTLGWKEFPGQEKGFWWVMDGEIDLIEKEDDLPDMD